MPKLLSFALCATLTLLPACGNLTGSDPSQRQPGVISSRYLRANPVTAPESVQAGVPFDVVITTLGFSGCWQAGGAHTETAGQVATLTPFDYVRTQSACTAMLAELSRTVSVRFDEPGSALLRVEGRAEQPDGSFEPTVIERAIVVR
jgi:hypothetical protein